MFRVFACGIEDTIARYDARRKATRQNVQCNQMNNVVMRVVRHETFATFLNESRVMISHFFFCNGYTIERRTSFPLFV